MNGLFKQHSLFITCALLVGDIASGGTGLSPCGFLRVVGFVEDFPERPPLQLWIKQPVGVGPSDDNLVCA
jgi:hypothetical protein